MKKKKINALKLNRITISKLSKRNMVGGRNTWYNTCTIVDLSELETCYSDCGYTENCGTNNCGTNNCGTNGCGTQNCSGGISCPGYVC